MIWGEMPSQGKETVSGKDGGRSQDHSVVDPGGMQEDPGGTRGHLQVSCACTRVSLTHLSSHTMNRVRLEKDRLMRHCNQGTRGRNCGGGHE